MATGAAVRLAAVLSTLPSREVRKPPPDEGAVGAFAGWMGGSACGGGFGFSLLGGMKPCKEVDEED